MHMTDLTVDRAETYVSAQESHIIEKSLSLGSGEVQIVQYTWDRPTTDVWTSNAYFLHMCLGARPGHARATYLDVDGRVSESIGRVMFVPPGRTVQSGSKRGTQRSLICFLSPLTIETILDGQPNLPNVVLAEGLHLNSPEVEWFLLKVYDVMHCTGFAQNFMVESLLGGLAVALVRTLRLHQDGTVASSGGLAPWRMQLIRERVLSDQSAPHLTELAGLCGMSVRHLTRAFKAETGMTIATFVEHAMVDRARILLSNSDHSIGEIATRLGFSTHSNFTYAFRRATGLLPAEFRRRSLPAQLVGSNP